MAYLMSFPLRWPCKDAPVTDSPENGAFCMRRIHVQMKVQQSYFHIARRAILPLSHFLK